MLSLQRENIMKPTGIISGTIPLSEEDILQGLKKTVMKTEFGNALVFLSEIVAFIPRHGIDKSIPPHKINHRANLKALRDIGVQEVIGLNSTGSLKKELEPGKIVIPDDYISISETPTIFHINTVHITPALDEGLREKLIQTAVRMGFDVIKKGVYWQTTGPRLETKAEIRMISQFADIVGMTMASEATIAKELELSYTAICSVDNYGHGITEKPPTDDEIREGARRNTNSIMRIIKEYVKDSAA